MHWDCKEVIMAFNTLSSKKQPTVEEMRKKMKSRGGVHVDPLLGESERAKPVVDDLYQPFLHLSFQRPGKCALQLV